MGIPRLFYRTACFPLICLSYFMKSISCFKKLLSICFRMFQEIACGNVWLAVTATFGRLTSVYSQHYSQLNYRRFDKVSFNSLLLPACYVKSQLHNPWHATSPLGGGRSISRRDTQGRKTTTLYNYLASMLQKKKDIAHKPTHAHDMHTHVIASKYPELART